MNKVEYEVDAVGLTALLKTDKPRTRECHRRPRQQTRETWRRKTCSTQAS